MKNLCKSLTKLLAAALLAAAMPLTAAATPNTINYQGRLLDNSGVPVNDTVEMTFKIYVIAGSLQWTSIRNVQIENGIYQVQLGDITSLASVDFSQSLELGVTVETDAEMTPRQTLSSVAHAQKAFDADYAAEASNADTLDFLDSADFIKKGEISTISTGMIVDGAITAADLGTGSVGASEIADGTITAADLAANSVYASEIAAGAVKGGTDGDIADGTITAADLADDYVNVSGDSMTGILSVEETATSSGGARVRSRAIYDTYGLLAIPQATDDFEGVLSADWSAYEIGVAGISVGSSDTDNYGVMGHSNTVGVRGEYSLSPTANYGELGKEGVGVYGTGTTWAGEFDGAVKAGSLEVTGQYRYAATQIHYYQMPALEFRPVGVSGDYCSTTAGGYICNNATNGSATAAVHLPQGATITSLGIYYRDNSTTSNFSPIIAKLYRKTPTTYSLIPSIASINISTTDAFASTNVLYTSVSDFTPETTTISELYQYYIEISMYLSQQTYDVSFQGCRITYTMDTVAP